MDLISSINNNLTVNISVLGKSGAGKTATIVKLLTKRFIGEYSSLIDDKYFLTLTNDSKNYFITIQDNDDQPSMDVSNIINWSHIIIVMFSITDRSSFNVASRLLQLIMEEHVNKSIKPEKDIWLIANKIDLDRFRVVLSDEGMKLINNLPVSYFESSAVNSYSMVEDLFLQIIQNYLNHNRGTAQRGSTQDITREKSCSPFSNVGMFGSSMLDHSSKPIRNSITSLIDLDIRRNSIENGHKDRYHECDSSIISKTSLNNLFNSSTKKIKAEGLKFFKRPK